MKEKTLATLFEQMQKSKGYSSLEATVSTVLEYLHDNKKGSRDLVTLVVSDFAMTQKILKLANSPMYAHFGKGGVSSISEALSILGTDALNHIIMSITVASALGDMEGALAKTLLSSEIARTVCVDENKEKAAIASLVYDLGNLMVSKYMPESLKVIDLLVAEGKTVDEAAVKVLGISLPDIGVEVAKRWKYPESMTSIIDGTGDQELIKVAKFSNKSAQLLQENKHEELATFVAESDLPDEMKEKVSGILEENNKLFTSVEIEPSTNILPEVVLKVCVPVKVSAAPVLQKLLEEVEEFSGNNGEVLARTILGTLFTSLKTAHCLVMAQNKSEVYFVKFSYGKGLDEIKSKFKFSAEYKSTAFHAALQKKVDVAIDDVSKLPEKSLPEGYRYLFSNTVQFMILPITAHSTTAVGGLLYLDWEENTVLDADEMAVIRKLRDIFSKFVP